MHQFYGLMTPRARCLDSNLILLGFVVCWLLGYRFLLNRILIIIRVIYKPQIPSKAANALYIRFGQYDKCLMFNRYVDSD